MAIARGRLAVAIAVAVGAAGIEAQFDVGTYDHVARGSGWTVWLQHDCHGNMRLLPSMPELGASLRTFGIFNKLFTTVRDRVLDAAQCHCSSIDATEAEQYFGPSLGNFLSAVQCTGATLNSLHSQCPISQPDNSFWNNVTWARLNANGGGDAIFPDGNLAMTDNWDPWGPTTCWTSFPSTCDANTYSTNGCKFQVTSNGSHGLFPDGERIQVAIKECDADTTSIPGTTIHKLPFFSLGCAGPLCENALKPCQTNADCGGSGRLTCDFPMQLQDAQSTTQLYTELETLLTDISLYEPLHNGHGCEAGTDVTDPGPEMQARLMGLIGQMYGLLGSTTENYQKMCIGVDEWDDFGDNVQQNGSLRMYEWDGDFPNGTNVFDHYSILDQTTPEPALADSCREAYVREGSGKIIPMMEYNCNGEFLLTPFSPLHGMAEFRPLHNFIANLLAPWMKTLSQSCTWGSWSGSGPSGTTDPAALLQTYFMWTPFFWMRMVQTTYTRIDRYTTGEYAGELPDSEHGGTIYQLLSSVLDLNDDSPVVDLPSSCTMSSFVNSGTCRLQTPALGDLLGLDITIRILIANCGSQTTGGILGGALPYFYMECTGFDCDAIAEPYNLRECNLGAGGQECSNVGSGLPRGTRLPCRAPHDELQINDQGLAGAILWNGRSPQTDQCSNQGTLTRTLLNAGNLLRGIAPTPATNTVNGYCTPIWEIEDVDADAWAEGSSAAVRNRHGNQEIGIISVDEDRVPNVVSIRDLNAWNPSSSEGCRNGATTDADQALPAAVVAPVNEPGGGNLPGASSGGSSDDDGLSSGETAGVVIGVLLLLAVLAVGAFVYYKQRQLGPQPKNTSPSVKYSSSPMNNAAYEVSNGSSITESHIGQRVQAKGYSAAGTLRYVGPVGDSTTMRAGIELDQPVGKNDGSARGQRYFQCAPQHGIFVVLEKVELLEDADDDL